MSVSITLLVNPHLLSQKPFVPSQKPGSDRSVVLEFCIWVFQAQLKKKNKGFGFAFDLLRALQVWFGTQKRHTIHLSPKAISPGCPSCHLEWMDGLQYRGNIDNLKTTNNQKGKMNTRFWYSEDESGTKIALIDANHHPYHIGLEPPPSFQFYSNLVPPSQLM